MADAPNTPTATIHHVLIMAATSIAVQATSPLEAAQIAKATAPGLIDPQELRWNPVQVSDRPFQMAEEGEEEPVIDVVKPTLHAL
jgi:hypothetical protein